MRISNFAAVILIVSAIVAGGITASSVSAAIVVYTPVGATASSEYSFDSRLASHTIDNSGLQFATPGSINSVGDLPNHDQAPTTIASPTHTPTHGGMWLTENGNGNTATIIFDLGSPQPIDRMFIWNYSEVPNANSTPIDETTRGVKSVTIYADNTVNPSALVTGAPTQFNQAAFAGSGTAGGAGNWNLDYDTAPVVYVLSSPITAQYIKFDIHSSWSDASFVGLSEVRFGDLVPEPASLSVIVMGMAMTLAGRKFRRA